MSPYVSIDEFKSAPTSVDTSNLDGTRVGNSAAQDAALTAILRRSSAWVDAICSQTLGAANVTETKETNLTRDGRLVVHTDNTPIITLTSAQYRLYPSLTFTPIDITQIQTYTSWFTVYGITTYNPSPSFIVENPAFGYVSPWQRQSLSDLPVTLQYTYTSGYMNTSLSGAVTTGAATITVADATGAYAGLKFTLYDGPLTEDCEVLSVAGNVITLKNALVNAHIDKTAVSAIPSNVKEATILLAAFLIRERGSVAISMNDLTMNGISSASVKSSDVDFAQMMLAPYKRVITS